MNELHLNIALDNGWRVEQAQYREGFSPLVLVTLADGLGAAHHVRVDVDKRMVVDSPPTAISQTVVNDIVEKIGKKRREAFSGI